MQNFPRTALFVATLMATASLAYADDAAKPADAAAPAAAPAEAPKPPPAGGATLTDILGNSGVELKGYIDVAASGTDLASLGNPYKINDNDHSALSLHGIGLTVDKLPKEGFGGLVNVLLGKDATLYQSYDTSTSNFDVVQGFIQYAHGPLTVQLGKLTTLMGAEVIDTSANANFSHSIGFGQYPYTHTGLRATYAVSDTTNLIAGVNTGWDQVKDANTQKTIELGLTSNPVKPLNITATIYSGVEPVLSPAGYHPGVAGNDGAQGNRSMFDTVISYAVTDALTFVLNPTYAVQEGVIYDDGSTHDVKWYSVSLYANYQIDEKDRLSLRLEDFQDKDGYKTSLIGGVAGTALGTSYKDDVVTLTYGYTAAANFELRAEVRFDTVDKDGVLTKPDGTSTKTGSSFGLQGVYKF